MGDLLGHTRLDHTGASFRLTKARRPEFSGRSREPVLKADAQRTLAPNSASRAEPHFTWWTLPRVAHKHARTFRRETYSRRSQDSRRAICNSLQKLARPVQQP